MDTTLLKSDSLNIKDQDKNAKLQGLLCTRELKRSTAENQFYQLMSYLMTLSISNSDETDNLCLDKLEPYIKTLFGANSGELVDTMRDAVDSLFGAKTYEKMSYSQFKLQIE